MGGNIVTGGYRCRAGVGGAIDNVFNFYWVGGAIQCWIDYTNVGSIAFSSDSRIKQNVRDYRGGLDSVMKMRIVRYEYKNEGIFEADGRVHEGFIAQELRKILPSAVDGDPTATTPSVEHTEFGPVPKQTPQPLSLRPLPIIAVTVQAVQELAEMVEQQGKQIQELQAALASIQGRTQ
nr:tail fiber domain-containing protein [Paraburkholderia sp. BCC1886]